VLGANGFKPEEQKVPDDVLVVVDVVKTGDDVVYAELFVGVLEQGDEGLLRAFGQLGLSDCHVEPVLIENGLPLAANPAHSGGREGELECLLGGRLRGVVAGGRYGFLPSILRVRGIFWIPRASALWELPTCAGNIKPAAEARRRGC